MRLRGYFKDALDPALWNARSDSANCRHDGSPGFCFTCTTAYVRMPQILWPHQMKRSGVGAND